MDILKAAAFVLLAFSLVSCSTTSSVKKGGSASEAGSSLYPAWYNRSGTFVAGSSYFFAYGAGLAADSATAVSKAVEMAKAGLATGISGKLESIRKQAASELGEEAGLDSPAFIMAMRRAESSIAAAAQPTQTGTGQMQASSGYRGFAEVRIERDELLQSLRAALSNHSSAWQSLANSEAFSQF